MAVGGIDKAFDIIAKSNSAVLDSMGGLAGVAA